MRVSGSSESSSFDTHSHTRSGFLCILYFVAIVCVRCLRDLPLHTFLFGAVTISKAL